LFSVDEWAPRCNPHRTVSEWGVIQICVDSQCLADLTGTAEEVAFDRARHLAIILVVQLPVPSHGLPTLERLERADQNGCGLLLGRGDDIQAVIDAVYLVYVRVPGRPEHRFSTLGWFSGIGVAGRVVGATIHLDFDNLSREKLAVDATYKVTADQLNGQFVFVTFVK
jgi:hypothetical protein